MLQMLQRSEHHYAPPPPAEENIVQLADSASQKVQHYAQIMSALMRAPLDPSRAPHVTRGVMDLIALTLKTVLEEAGNEVYLRGVMNFYMPQVPVSESFAKEMEDREEPYQPQGVNLSEMKMGSFQFLTNILTSTIEYNLHQAEGASYYEYRRHIYIFRNQYLPYILSLSLELFTTLTEMAVKYVEAYPCLEQLMPLLEGVWMFPFAMSLHETDGEEEPGEAIAGAYGGDVYFPGYFRPVLSSRPVLNAIASYIRALIELRQPYEQVRGPLNVLVKIAGRLCAASSYSFKTDRDKGLSREYGVDMLMYLCDNMTYFDDYFISSVLEALTKVMTMSDRHLSERKPSLISNINRFLFKVVSGLPIVLAEGQRSPIAKAFDLISFMEDVSREKIPDSAQRQSIKMEFQSIWEAFLTRILGAEAVNIVKNYGCNVEGEI